VQTNALAPQNVVCLAPLHREVVLDVEAIKRRLVVVDLGISVLGTPVISISHRPPQGSVWMASPPRWPSANGRPQIDLTRSVAEIRLLAVHR